MSFLLRPECDDGAHEFSFNLDEKRDECVRCGDVRLPGMKGRFLYHSTPDGRSVGLHITNKWYTSGLGVGP